MWVEATVISLLQGAVISLLQGAVISLLQGAVISLLQGAVKYKMRPLKFGKNSTDKALLNVRLSFYGVIADEQNLMDMCESQDSMDKWKPSVS